MDFSNKIYEFKLNININYSGKLFDKEIGWYL